MKSQPWQKQIDFVKNYRDLLLDMWILEITAWELEIAL